MTITEEQLSRALAGAADEFPAGEWDGPLEKSPVPAWWRRGPVQVAGLVAASVAAVLVAASLGSGSASHLTASSPSRSAQADAYGDAGASGSAAGGVAGLADKPAEPSLSSLKPQVHGPAGTEVLPAAPAGPAEDTTRIVQTGSISLVVDDGKVAVTVERLGTIARGAGGSVSSSTLQSAGDDPSADVTIRVPVARFNGVVAQITSKGFGAKVVRADTAGKDVTAEYADTAAQIASLKAARDRYLAILRAAKTVGEILSVQQRVDDVQGQIDRLEGARRLLANQSDLATLEVSVNQKTTQVLVKPEPSGWSKAWHDAGHGFTSGIQSLVAHSGRALLVLMVLTGLVLFARTAWRVGRRRLL